MSSAAAAFLLEYRATRVRKRKKGTKEKREGERQSARAKKKGVRTSDDFFGKHEFAGRLMKKKKKEKNNNFAARYTVMESRADVMRNPAN